MASSTRMPVTSVMPSRLTRLSEKPEQLHRPERRDGRQRQGDGGDQRGAHVAQEDEHDEHGERGAFEQRLHRGGVVAARVGDGVVDLGEADVGVLLAELGQPGVDDVGDGQLARAFGAEHGEGDDRLAVEARKRALLAGVVDHLAEIGQAHMAAARQAGSWSRPAPRPGARRPACGSPAPGRRPRRGRRPGRRWWRAPGC